MARKKSPPPATYEMPESQLFANILRYPRDGGPPIPQACLQVPEWSIGPPEGNEPTIMVDSDHLCRDNKGVVGPVHGSGDYLYLTEKGWHAHKHRLLGKITQAQIAELDAQFALCFASFRDAATKQRDKLRKQLVELEAYWPHLRDEDVTRRLAKENPNG